MVPSRPHLGYGFRAAVFFIGLPPLGAVGAGRRGFPILRERFLRSGCIGDLCAARATDLSTSGLGAKLDSHVLLIQVTVVKILNWTPSLYFPMLSGMQGGTI